MKDRTQFEPLGQTFILRSDMTLFWQQQNALVLADTHFGKAATFRNRGIPVPSGTTDVMLQRLTVALHETSASQIFFLGDFVHSHTRHETDFESELVAWRSQHHDISMTLILGNHDRGQRALFHQLKLETVDEPLVVDNIGLCHYPETEVTAGVYKLAGHIHPAVSFGNAGDRTGKLPCFHFGQTVGVLPAFGEFTGTALVQPCPEDSVFGIADGCVVKIPATAFRQSAKKRRNGAFKKRSNA